MVNLIQQQDMLKSLGDAELQAEATTPSGTVPPFLVLTEINRRKSMRDAYAAQTARRQPSTTVAEDLLSAPMGTPGREAMGRSGASRDSGEIGIAAALREDAPDQAPAFAEGGLVPSGILERIAARRLGSLDTLDRDREDILGRSLMAAGGAMMANGSANFMRNIGAGVSGGIAAWNEGNEVIDSREAAALDDLMGVHQSEQAEKLAMLDEQFRRDEAARMTSQFTAESNAPTAAMRNYEFFNGLDPEEQVDYLRVNGGGGVADSTIRGRAMAAFNDTQTAVRTEVMKSYADDPAFKYGTPEEKAAIQARIEAEIAAKTADRFTRVYPDYASLMPQLTATSATPTTVAAPAADADWTQYFEE